jgi:V8-like Glu-specific endopeptidase
MKKVITFVLVVSMLFCGTFSSVYVSAEENSGSETEYLNYEPAYTPTDRIGQNIDSRSIIVDDDRVPVDDVTVSPYCKIVYIRSFFRYNGRIFTVRSTGFILGPDLIVTAGHALFREFEVSEGLFVYLTAYSCKIYLEMEGQVPFEADGESTEIYVPYEYRTLITTNRSYYDWGYIIVDEPVGYTQGWFGFGTLSQTQFVDVAGYPLRYPEENQESDNYNMYKGWGSAAPNPYTDLLIKHGVDTTTGQSGSPMYDTNQIVWGIHVLGKVDFNGDNIGENWNNGIRITSGIYELLRTKKQEGIDRWS